MTMIVSTYPNYAQAQQAVQALEREGVDSDDISLITNDADEVRRLSQGDNIIDGAGTGATVGTAIGAAGGLLAGLGLMAIPGVGPVVAAGWFASTLTGAATGAALGAATGSIIGAFTEQGIDETQAKVYEEHIRQGGSVVCVRANSEDEERIKGVLRQVNPLASTSSQTAPTSETRTTNPGRNV